MQNNLVHVDMYLFQVVILWPFYPGSVNLNNVVAFSYNEQWRNTATNKFSVISQMLRYPTTAIYDILQVQELDYV